MANFEIRIIEPKKNQDLTDTGNKKSLLIEVSNKVKEGKRNNHVLIVYSRFFLFTFIAIVYYYIYVTGSFIDTKILYRIIFF